MARIARVTLPPKKRVDISLRYIYGIGPTLATKVLAEAQVDPAIRTEKLSEEQVGKLRDIIEKRHKVEGELRRDVLMNIKRLKEIGTWRGSRHAKGLPVRGQRTKTNSRTRRGNKRHTMGSGKRKMEKT